MNPVVMTDSKPREATPEPHDDPPEFLLRLWQELERSAMKRPAPRAPPQRPRAGEAADTVRYTLD